MKNNNIPPLQQIVIVGPLPPPFGGMANQTEQLANKLSAEGIEVKIIRWNRAYWPRWIGKIPIIRAGFRLIPYLWELWRVAGQQNFFHIMGNSGWSWHLFAAPAIWIASIRGCIVVLNYRGGEAESFFSRSFRYVRPTLERCDQVIVPSGFLKEIFARYGVEVKVVRNPLDLEKFRVKSKNKHLKKGPNLAVCRNLESIYGIPCALRAFVKILDHHPTSILWITGSGSQEKELKLLTEKLGITDKVIFTGRLTPDQMVKLYHKADIVLNPSEVDNAPNSLLEAWAAGVPIVTTNAGGIPHLVKHKKTALLIPVNDDLAMAEAALEILNNPSLGCSLRKAGYLKARDHAWEEVKYNLFFSYSQAVEKHRLKHNSVKNIY